MILDRVGQESLRRPVILVGHEGFEPKGHAFFKLLISIIAQSRIEQECSLGMLIQHSRMRAYTGRKPAPATLKERLESFGFRGFDDRQRNLRPAFG